MLQDALLLLLRPPTHPALTCAVCAALCVQLMQFVSGTLANMLGRGAAELEEEGATRASLAAAAQQRRAQDEAAADASRRAGAEALRGACLQGRPEGRALMPPRSC